MANTVTGPEVLQENDKRVTLKIIVQSDGSTSTTVFYDASARTIAGAATRGALQRIWFACDTGDGGDSYARLDFEDSDGDRPLLGLTGSAYWDFREFGGLPPSTDANTNGDINIVIPSAADAGNMYTVIAEFIKTGSV
tara:strand:+ start:240 stop:653 length:414 start_codon:yes stop_codon:yes gene_type:complete